MTKPLRTPAEGAEARQRSHETRLAAAREALGVRDAISLALRDHRGRLGLSQRAYASARRWSKSFAGDLEAHPGDIQLARVLDALDGTGFALALVREPVAPVTPAAHSESTPPRAGTLKLVAADEWDASELLARDSEGRCLPAHQDAESMSLPHTWWFTRHGYFAANEPQWTWRRRR